MYKNLKRTQAVHAFLHKGEMVNNRDLIARWTAAMETQVNVVIGQPVLDENGKPKRNVYTDGEHTWAPFRVPKKADSTPEDNDYPLRWPLDKYVEAIGCTGWDWQNQCSRWVGFDFDSITGHAVGVGIDAEQLEQIRELACALPYVEVRKSTGGAGIHLYVLLDEIPTANHTEHAALGRHILCKMSIDCGFDFASQVDACGGNMWIWHSKMTAENEGLKLIKASEYSLKAADLSENWRDHVEVVTKRRRKVRVVGVSDEELDAFEQLTLGYDAVPLDDAHKACIAEAGRLGFTSVWVHDHGLWQTHTKALEEILNGNRVKIKGVFQTISEGTDKATPNCFCFPVANGEFRVYRFSKGTAEAPTWNYDGTNWTWCQFNALPDFRTAAIAAGGSPVADSDGFSFANASEARPVVEILGGRIFVPDELAYRPMTLRPDKKIAGRIIASVRRNNGTDAQYYAGWENTKQTEWRCAIDVTIAPRHEPQRQSHDQIVRLLVAPDGANAGWFATTVNADWVRHTMDGMKSILAAFGYLKQDAAEVLGLVALNPWRLVNLPFQPEYPGGRQWNKDAAQFKFQPAALEDDETPHHPHWDLILDHIGSDLTASISKSEWCRAAGIQTGADYLRHWIACMFRFPLSPLPYLFLYGPQNSGKSILHEAISQLLTKGFVSADRALTNQQDFNGELANAILCTVEEKNISRVPGAYNKIKAWTTGLTISIRRMRMDSYDQANSLHWIQCANHAENCPVLPGDSRITVIHVPLPTKEIPKEKLIEALVNEAPHFMRTLFDLELAEPVGRLRIPVIETGNKHQLADGNRTPSEAFFAEETLVIPGARVLFADLKERIRSWLPLEHAGTQVSDEDIRSALPKNVCIGRGPGNKRYVANLSFSECSPSAPWTVKEDGYLTQRA